MAWFVRARYAYGFGPVAANLPLCPADGSVFASKTRTCSEVHYTRQNRELTTISRHTVQAENPRWGKARASSIDEPLWSLYPSVVIAVSLTALRFRVGHFAHQEEECDGC